MQLSDISKKLFKESTLCRIGVALGFVIVFLGIIPLPFEDTVPLELESRPRLIKGMLIIGLGVYLAVGCLLWMRGKSRMIRRQKPLMDKMTVTPFSPK